MPRRAQFQTPEREPEPARETGPRRTRRRAAPRARTPYPLGSPFSPRAGPSRRVPSPPTPPAHNALPVPGAGLGPDLDDSPPPPPRARTFSMASISSELTTISELDRQQEASCKRLGMTLGGGEPSTSAAPTTRGMLGSAPERDESGPAERKPILPPTRDELPMHRRSVLVAAWRESLTTEPPTPGFSLAAMRAHGMHPRDSLELYGINTGDDDYRLGSFASTLTTISELDRQQADAYDRLGLSPPPAPEDDAENSGSGSGSGSDTDGAFPMTPPPRPPPSTSALNTPRKGKARAPEPRRVRRARILDTPGPHASESEVEHLLGGRGDVVVVAAGSQRARIHGMEAEHMDPGSGVAVWDQTWWMAEARFGQWPRGPTGTMLLEDGE